MKTRLENFGFAPDSFPAKKTIKGKLKKDKCNIILLNLQVPVLNNFEKVIVFENNFPEVKAFRSSVNNELFYSKIIRYSIPLYFEKRIEKEKNSVQKCICLNYLKQLTKSNSGIAEMIKAYIEETPQLINTMKKGIDNKDWESLRTAAHSISPSFAMMGINIEFENSAKIMQCYAKSLLANNSGKLQKTNIALNETVIIIEKTIAKLYELLLKIEKICKQACEELKMELADLKMN